MNKFGIAIHGGAGTILKSSMTAEKEAKYKSALQAALELGYKCLEDGGSSVEAVRLAGMSLEDSPLFNAGKGSVFTATGTHEMDASIMEGKNREAGAVSAISGVKNPIDAAYKVMMHSDHVFLTGEGAEEFCKLNDCTFETESYFHDDFRYQQWKDLQGTDKFQLDHAKVVDEKFGTIGAVALDIHGDIAAVTSTGGMTNKKFGRVGDSPIIGSGVYANNLTCAVSCTGSGEYFIRSVTAYDVSCLMEHKGLSLDGASREVVHKRLLEINGDGGLIAVDKKGNISMPFNTEGMYRAMKKSSGEMEISIYKE